MLADLSNLGKTADNVVSGFIGFFYNTVSALFLVAVRPLHNSLRQFVLNRVTASSVMFVTLAVLLAIAFYGSTALHEVSKTNSPNFVTYIVGLIILYIFLDVSMTLLATYVAPRGRRRLRAQQLLRYSAAVTVILWSLYLLFIKEYLPLGYDTMIYPNRIQLVIIVEWLGQFVLSYPLFLTYYGVLTRWDVTDRIKSSSASIGREICDVLVILGVVLFGFRVFVVGSTGIAALFEKGPPPYEVRAMRCFVGPDHVWVNIVLHNQNAEVPLIVDPEQFEAYFYAPNPEIGEAFRFPRGSDSLIARPKEAVNVGFDVTMNPRTAAAVDQCAVVLPFGDEADNWFVDFVVRAGDRGEEYGPPPFSGRQLRSESFDPNFARIITSR